MANKYLDRDDVLPEGRAPLPFRKMLAKVGGLNQYGENLYRLVLAQSCMEWHGGQFWDWPENTSLQDQGGLQFSEKIVRRKHLVQRPDRHGKVGPVLMTVDEPEGMMPSMTQPLRVVVESRYVQKYPTIDGWILQRWRPASHWGSRALWEGMKYPGTEIQMLGPYPERGAYEIAIEWVDDTSKEFHRTSWSRLPDLGALEGAIAYLEEKKIEETTNDPQMRMLIKMHERKERIAAMQRRVSEERKALIRDEIRPYLSDSLNGVRLRHQVANKTGIKEHITI